MNKKIEAAFNEQMNFEIYSAHLYLSMSAYFEAHDLSGFSNYMRVQYQEENSHALKIFDHIIERGGKVQVNHVGGNKPFKSEWSSVLEVFEDTLSHEEEVTDRIHNLLAIVHEEKDYPSAAMLQWYVKEQVEEEGNVKRILQQLRLIDGNGVGVFMLDRELQNRVFVDNTKSE